jgi:RNA polymerase sigma factor (sigma-70 family)
VSAVAPLPADTTGLLYERHHQRIFGFCLSQLGSREDAEDAVQTTFINAQRGLHRGVVPEFELAWLFTIARNVCHNTRDSASRRGRVEAVRDLDALQDIVAVPERGGDVSLGELMHVLGGIPERQRQALLLREFQGLSYEEIAKELSVSVAAVETLIFRARRSVAEQLGRKQRRGMFAWLLALLRWPFQGGAVPLKLAGVTATVATTASLAVVPLTIEHSPAQAPVAPSVDASRLDVSAPRQAHEPTRGPKTDATPAKTVVATATPPQLSPPPVAGNDELPTPSTTPPAASPAGGDAETVATPTPPVTVAVPSVSLDPITTPGLTVTVPEVTLPPVELPELQLPPVPNLPKLP